MQNEDFICRYEKSPMIGIAMRGLWTLLIVTSTLISSSAQPSKIAGEVFDSNGKPLGFASAFLNKTTLGAVADEKGSFTIAGVPAGVYELVVSFVGYSPYQKVLRVDAGQLYHLQIKLTPNLTVLKEVNVSEGKDKEWGRKLDLFRKVFIGTNKEARMCKITNPWVINFQNDGNNKRSQTNLIADASSPLEIENRALGYRIIYYLQKFRADFQQGIIYDYNFQGTMRFEEIFSPDSLTEKKWREQRMYAYLGSYRHLLKSIIDQKVKEEGYELFEPAPPPVRDVFTSKIISSTEPKRIDPAQLKAIPTAMNLFTIDMNKWEVHYSRKTGNYSTQEISLLSSKHGNLLVDSAGVLYNSNDFVVSGKMFEQRVAMHLPYDFRPKKSGDLIRIKGGRDISNLEEKAYLHTDKVFYNPGEKVWFKIYFNYRTPALRDSLSRIVYTELIKESGEILLSKSLQVKDGGAAGTFELNPKIQPGNYFIRIYTNWMLNFGGAYTKAIKVFDPYDIPVIAATDSLPQSSGAKSRLIGLSRDYFSKDQIAFEVELRDTDNKPIGGVFSTAVTDITQVGVPQNETTIVDQFPFASTSFKATRDTLFPVESGISIGGTYSAVKKGSSAKRLVMIELKNNKIEDGATTQTNNDGEFWLSGLQYYDSAQIGFMSIGEKKKSYRIALNKRKTPSTKDLKSDLQFNTRRLGDVKRILSKDTTLKAKVLKGVTVYAPRIDTVERAGDYQVSGESVCKFSSITLALQSSVPGLYVFGGAIRIGPPSSFTSSEPLVIIDGVRLSGSSASSGFGGGDGAGDILLGLNPCSIDRIEVYKYGAAAMFGAAGAPGVIVVHTKAANFETNRKARAPDLSWFHLFKQQGYSETEQFNSTKENKLTTMRSTVYWQPSSTVDAKSGRGAISFRIPSSGIYRVVIEGVNSNYEPFRIVSIVKTYNSD